jgi:DNA polymerase I-like protein with 3'-5' exonuclease and polymerase domains
VNRAKRQGPNAVIQSTASDMMVTAIILINKALRKKGYKSRLIMTVHDSIVLDCLRSEVAEVASLCLDIMENLPQRAAGVWGKGFDWSWLRCPIVAEGEIGLNWRDCVPYRPGAAEARRRPRCRCRNC